MRALLGLALFSLAAFGCGRASSHASHEAARPRPAVEGAPIGLVPWRDPLGDLAAFFPGATGYRTETRTLSDRRLQLARDLGRPPVSDDLLLRFYRVYRKAEAIGVVLVRRVKGEHGAIELVLAVAPNGRLRGVRLQRMREPELCAAALQSQRWRAAFSGKTAASAWRVGEDLPSVPPAALGSAQAIADGARTALVLLRAAEEPA